MCRKIFLAVTVSVALFTTTAFAEDTRPRIAVVDFALLSGAVTGDLNAERIGLMCLDYIIEAIVDSGKFFLVSKDYVAEKLESENLEGTGIISLSEIRRIGKLLGVDYLIIGNVYGVGGDQTVLEVASNGAKINEVRACIIARMVDVATGKIVAMAEGRGESKSSLVKFGKNNIGFITIGTKNIPQVSVHNSVKAAAFSLVEDFLKSYTNWGRSH